MKHWILSIVLLAGAAAIADEGENQSVSFSRTIEMKVEQETVACMASASFDYLQYGPEAEVEATIDNDDCAASSGQFVVVATIRVDGEEEARKLEFPETWRRDDDSPVILAKRYPIGDNADLRRIRIRKMTCICSVVEDEKKDDLTDTR